MVVNPKDLLKTITEQEETILVALERRIDEELKRKFNGSNDVCVDTRNLWDQLRPILQNKLLNNYREAGWKVQFESDQREDSYLRFTYKGN